MRRPLVMLGFGVLTAAFAWRIGWSGWAVYLSVGHVLVNLYPVFLPRYTRARLARIDGRMEEHVALR